ncbi:hypothetical protein VA249_45140 (plasmid) [Vibrio alfacsensis]|nr:hypothetical protein VA249_45140 [Vibrio alfacsensis]
MRNFTDMLIFILTLIIFVVGLVEHGFGLFDACLMVFLYLVYRAYFVKIDSVEISKKKVNDTDKPIKIRR